MLYRIVAENQLHHYPDSPANIAQKIRKDLREGFYPSDSSWHEDTLRLYDKFWKKLMVEFNLN
jgi:hypothetical protein